MIVVLDFRDGRFRVCRLLRLRASLKSQQLFIMVCFDARFPIFGWYTLILDQTYNEAKDFKAEVYRSPSPQVVGMGLGFRA